MDLNPLIVSRWQVLLLYFAIIVSFIIYQTRSFEKTLIMSTLTYLNLQLVDLFYLQLIKFISYTQWYFYPIFVISACLILWCLLRIELLGIERILNIRPKLYNPLLGLHFILCLALLVPPVYQTLLELTGEDASLKQFILIINLTIFVLFLVGVSIVYYGLKQIQKAEREMANAKINQEYSSMMEKQYTEVRKFRHDYKNILLSLEGLIRDQDWSSLENYYFRELATSSQQIQSDAIALERLVYIPNSEIRNIFYTKLSYALSHSIKVNLEIDQGLPKLEDHLMDLSRMLGIILDNAIEECQKYTQAQIEIVLTDYEEELSIAISNYTEAKATDLIRMKELGFSTKGDNRGFGLANLQEIAHEAGFELHTSIESSSFFQEIYIPLS